MKRCPECRRDYYDDSLLYCLDDGSPLLEGPTSAQAVLEEPATAILHETAPQEEARTRTQIHSTEQAGAPPSSTGDSAERIHGFDKRLIVVPLLVAIVALGGFLGYRYFRQAAADQINSIAVLPFANDTGDKEADFLAEGIAETLINNFTRIPELKVAARSTAFRFRGREGEPVEVGRELKVGSMLTGRVMQRGDQMSIQQRIATDVSSQLKLKLSGAQTEQVAKTYTQSPAAYQNYLRGRFHWNRRTGEDLQKALEYFQAAADADPDYALAYVGLADTYVLLPEYVGTQFEEVEPKARLFAERALQIDQSLGEPHATLGLIHHYSWQWDAANREFERAIELNPNHPTSHHWYANNLRERGEYQRALAEIRRAHDLDPLSGIININLGILLALNGDMPASRAQFNRTIELDKNWFNGYFWRGMINIMDGRVAESIPDLQKSVELNRATRQVGLLGYALAATGRRSEALELAKELEDRYSNGTAAASNIAGIYIGLGEKEKAYEWLEKGFLDKDLEIIRIAWTPQFNPLRSDPRFKEFQQRVGGPQ